MTSPKCVFVKFIMSEHTTFTWICVNDILLCPERQKVVALLIFLLKKGYCCNDCVVWPNLKFWSNMTYLSNLTALFQKLGLLFLFVKVNLDWEKDHPKWE